MSLSTTIKSIQDIMRKDAGVDGDAQRIGQLVWMLFLKIFSDLEIETELEDDDYESPVPPRLRWNAWANEDLVGTEAPTGDALLDFVDNTLFPTLKDLDVARVHRQGPPARRAAAQRLRGRLQLHEVRHADAPGDQQDQPRHRLQRVEDPPPLRRHLRADPHATSRAPATRASSTRRAPSRSSPSTWSNPRLGETVLDPACGTGGFLTCAFEHMRTQDVKTPERARRAAGQHPRRREEAAAPPAVRHQHDGPRHRGARGSATATRSPGRCATTARRTRST